MYGRQQYLVHDSMRVSRRLMLLLAGFSTPQLRKLSLFSTDSASTTLAREELIQNYQANVGPVLKACQQLVDALVEHVIDLDLG